MKYEHSISVKSTLSAIRRKLGLPHGKQEPRPFGRNGGKRHGKKFMLGGRRVASAFKPAA